METKFVANHDNNSCMTDLVGLAMEDTSKSTY